MKIYVFFSFKTRGKTLRIHFFIIIIITQNWNSLKKNWTKYFLDGNYQFDTKTSALHFGQEKFCFNHRSRQSLWNRCLHGVSWIITCFLGNNGAVITIWLPSVLALVSLGESFSAPNFIKQIGQWLSTSLKKFLFFDYSLSSIILLGVYLFFLIQAFISISTINTINNA